MTRALPALLLSALLAAVAALTGCTTAAGDDRPLVVATTNILGDIVGAVVGDQAQVLTLMPPGGDPHSFQASARDAARVDGAALVVANGLGLEEGLAQLLENLRAPVLEAGEVVEVLAYADGDAAGAPDPHLWTDPGRVVDVVRAVAAEIAATVPGVDAARVAANADAYVRELEQLDTEMAEAFARIPPGRRNLVTNHHVFGYLADRHGFRVVGAVVPSGTTLAAPSASDLRDLARAIEEAGVRAIFVEHSAPSRLAEVLAEEVGVDVAVVALHTESLTAPGGGADTYLAMMRANTELITTGLTR